MKNNNNHKNAMEAPECCGEPMEPDGKLCKCFTCGNVIEDQEIELE